MTLNEILNQLLGQNDIYITAALIAVTAVLAVIAVILIIEVVKLKKKYSSILSGDGSIDDKFDKFIEESKSINEKYEKISEALIDLSSNVDKCVQKVGIIRYNPFEEAGGNLCFAIALLDSDNNGVVINGIHSRSGCYTYAKPIELGVSEYVLSTEEQQAIDMAINGSYSIDNRKEIVKEIKEHYEAEVLPRRQSRRKKGVFSKKSKRVSAE